MFFATSAADGNISNLVNLRGAVKHMISYLKIMYMY